MMNKAIVSSSGTNAYSIYVSAKKIGVDVLTLDKKPFFPIPVSAEKEGDFLFTDEEAMYDFLGQKKNGCFFLPNDFPKPLFDNKWEFSKWIFEKDIFDFSIKQWSVDSKFISYPCVIKSKSSRKRGENIPKGWVCHTSSDLSLCFEALKSDGISVSDFFVQEWFDDEKLINVSICGFHDCENHKRNLSSVVKRLCGKSSKLSSTSVLEVIEDLWDMEDKKNAILDGLKFKGPYEIEFLILNDKVYFLEINPRFWMQNYIFIFQDNGLIKRYFSLDDEGTQDYSSLIGTVFVDSLYFFRSIVKFDFCFWCVLFKKFFGGDKVVFWPSLPVSLLCLVRRKFKLFFYL